MQFTVAICTWNRSRLLDQTLAEMRGLIVPPGVEWELLVVNNNCTDDTDAVLAKYAGQLPIRRLFEERPGQCQARNRALDEARGDVILWTDDDVLVDPCWLSAYARAVQEQPEIGFFGGPIRPWFEQDPPAWLQAVWPVVQSAYATRDLGEAPCDFEMRRLPFGANFAVRTELQRRYRYDPNVGLRPGSTLRGDEIGVLRGMLRDGICGRWVPDAPVRHYIPAMRQTTAYLRGYFFGQGQYRAIESKDSEVVSPKLFGRPRWLWRSAVQNEFSYRIRRCLSSPEKWINALIESSIAWGQLAEHQGEDQVARSIRRLVSVRSG